MILRAREHRLELGGRPRVGRISGGGARSQLWLEIVASVLEMPLEATVVGWRLPRLNTQV